MKTYDYIITFKGRDNQLINRISQFMLLLAVAVFVFSAFVAFSRSSLWPLVISLLITGWYFYISRQIKKGNQAYYRIALLLAALGWYLQPHGLLPAIVYLAAALMEKQVRFPQEVAFDTEGVVFNSFPKKYYEWAAFSNVLLKDGLLTIDFKNNKLVQREIESPVSWQEEQEFNEFCRRHITVKQPL